MIVTNERLFFLIAHNDWTTFRALFKSYSTQAGKPDQIIIDNKFLSNFGKVTQGNDRILSSKVPRMQGLIRKKLFGSKSLSQRVLSFCFSFIKNKIFMGVFSFCGQIRNEYLLTGMSPKVQM